MVVADKPASQPNSEFFELGVYGGLINVQDFNTELMLGIRATFHASEDFFLQFNGGFSHVEESAFEESQGSLFEGSDRNYGYYNFLVGYNVLQGEVFPSGTQGKWTNLYLVGGVGNTDFGGEEAFTATIGIGYRVNVSRHIIISVDLRDHSYKSNLISENDRVHNVELSTGLSWLF